MVSVLQVNLEEKAMPDIMFLSDNIMPDAFLQPCYGISFSFLPQIFKKLLIRKSELELEGA